MEKGDMALVACKYLGDCEKGLRLKTVDTGTILIATEEEVYIPKAKTDAEKFADYMNGRNKGNR